MKRLLIICALLCFKLAVAQHGVLEDPRLIPYTQNVVVYNDSLFTQKNSISTQFLKLTLLEWAGKGWKVEKSGTLSFMRDKKGIIYIKEDQFVKTTKYREFLEKQDSSAKVRHDVYLTSLIKKYGKNMGISIFHGVPTIGMTKEQFLMCRDWPDKINSTETVRTISDQWIYNYGQWGSKYYYFTNGKLTAIQD